MSRDYEKGCTVKKNTIAFVGGAVLAAALAACGGGGGGSSPAPSVPSTPTPTPMPQTLSATAVDYTSGAALSGFTVTVGSVPSASTCLAAQTQTSNPCGVPASPLPTVTTAANGSFSVTVPAAGTYMLQIAKDTTYATLHRTVAVNGPTALGTVKITALSADEQAWLADVNQQRATVAVPTSFSNLVVDEYAEEQARAWASDVAAGRTTFGDAQYGPYQTAYAASSGALYGAAGVLAINLLGQLSAYISADNSWMSEKANCPGGNWQTCTFSETTGHYINMSNTNTVWAGLGESATVDTKGYSYYDVMLVENSASTGPASRARLPAL